MTGFANKKRISTEKRRWIPVAPAGVVAGRRTAGVALVRAARLTSPSSLRLDERAALQIAHRLPNLLLRVHHDGAVPSDRLFNRFAGDKQEVNSFWRGLDGDLVTAIKQYERVILDVIDGRGLRSMDLFRYDSLGIGSIAKPAGAGDYV